MRVRQANYLSNIALFFFEAKLLGSYKLHTRFPLLYGLRFAAAIKRCNRGYFKSTQLVETIKRSHNKTS